MKKSSAHQDQVPGGFEGRRGGLKGNPSPTAKSLALLYAGLLFIGIPVLSLIAYGILEIWTLHPLAAVGVTSLMIGFGFLIADLPDGGEF